MVYRKIHSRSEAVRWQTSVHLGLDLRIKKIGDHNAEDGNDRDAKGEKAVYDASMHLAKIFYDVHIFCGFIVWVRYTHHTHTRELSTGQEWNNWIQMFH